MSSLCLSFQAWRTLLSNNGHIQGDSRLYEARAVVTEDLDKELELDSIQAEKC